MSAIFLSGDLMFGSRVTAAAQATGQTVHTALSAPRALALLREHPARLLIVDLHAPGVTIEELVPAARTIVTDQSVDDPAAVSNTSKLRIIAYAPHVHTELLARAAAAGCDEVLSQGEFSRSLPRLFATG
ncbi:MAG: hypothetical protein SFX18_08160 [Pirellulales bacterium]|nr:hypothetical protein [Pirellulales bacterium]